MRSYATSRTVVIRSIVAADSIDTNDELVEIENTSSEAIDITNWSLVYISSTNSTSTLATFRMNGSAHVILPAGARETAFSTKYIANHPVAASYQAATAFSGKMGYTTAGIELRDDADNSIDTVRWGSAWAGTIDASPAPSMSATTLLQRSGNDTDNNKNDFKLLAQVGQAFSYGNLYEVVDQCANIDGLQTAVPTDFTRDASGNCVSVDVCSNLDGIQREVPAGDELYLGACVPVFVPAALFITEVLPNPGGVDTGHEFVELYNDSDSPVSLNDYVLVINGKYSLFAPGLTIVAKNYLTVSDTDLGVVLPNASGVSMTLLSRNNITVDTAPTYTSAPIDMSWALINDTWQYTNQPTPGSANKPSLVDDGEIPTPEPGVVACAEGYYRNPTTGRCKKLKAEEVPASCRPNQYRSEETGRCRNYATASTPVACKDGQYRSETTGRCRSIALTASASLKPCGDDQFRNPATGRCKKIASTDDLPKPCASGYERNAETNRCRKVQTSKMPIAAFPVEPIRASNSTIGAWITAGVVVTSGLGYAAWEWRREIASLARRIVGMASIK